MAEPNLITAVELVLWWRQNLQELNLVNSEHDQVKYCIRRLPLHYRKPLIHFRSWNSLLEAAEIIDIAYHDVSVPWINTRNIISNTAIQPSQSV